MRPQVLALALAASVAAVERDVDPRAKDPLDCVEDLIKAIRATPTVPAEFSGVTGDCVPTSLTKEYNVYSSQFVSWASAIRSEIRECPDFDQEDLSVPSIDVPTCGSGASGASATVATATTTSAASKGTSADVPTRSTTTSAASSASSTSSTSTSAQPSTTNGAARESGVMAAAAVAVLAAIAF